MAKVSLRIYNREIEGLIDQGHTDEAIAHCRHILKTFPKHLETYRLLGKAYLEFKRYNEAVDIFSRVLMSVPDDFVSHVGMSIINDEQNRIDNAIWHMERAFEAQPSNPAIQGELQRLYGRRDGMEPPKVRMTRGALAHMYVQGELYPQAIAEIRAVLGQDANRTDMQVLLAKAYFKSGQKADASDICSQLLKRYPYCFDANRVMVDLILASQGAAETTQVYRMRVGELDPYATFAKDSVFQSNEVADAAINLERLEYSGEEVPLGQEWSSSLGIKLDASSAPALEAGNSADQPDWLKNFSSTQEDTLGGVESFDAPQDSMATPASDDNIPDFLRAAGWGESSGEAELPVSFFDEPETADGGIAAPADIPDWLKGQMPSEPSGAPAQSNAPAQSLDTPDWLSGLEDSSQAAPSRSFESVSNEPAPAEQGDLPDWLSGLGAPASAPQQDELPPAQPANIPDWLSGLSDQPAESASIESLGSTAQEQDDAVAWLESLAAKHGAKPEELVTDPNKRSDIAPDWVQQASASQTQEPAQPVNVDSLGSSAQEQDDAVAWLESLAAKHGAKPEELVTDPNKRSDIAPDWVQQASASQTQEPVQSVNVDSLGSSAQEQDDAVAWLESLAAKHGAKPEELVTDPNKRSDIAPDWVQQATSAAEMQSSTPKEEMTEQPKEWSENAMNIGEQFFAEFETASTAAPDETGMWLRDLDEKEKQEEESLQRADIPDWLSDTKEPVQEIAQQADLPDWMSGLDSNIEQEPAPVVQNLSQDELSNWLNDLDDQPKSQPVNDLPDWSADALEPQKVQEENLWGEPAQQKIEPASVEETVADLPDWLSGIDSKNEATEDDWKQPAADGLIYSPALTPTEEPAPVQLTADLPDWLQGMDEEAALIEGDDDNTPPWMHRELWESQDDKPQPKPTTPSDWHPVESKSADVAAAQPKQQKPASTHVESREPEKQPVMQSQIPAEPKKKAAPAKKSGVKQTEPQVGSSVLTQAKSELDRGDIPAALEHYEKLIKKGKNIEDVIRDLNESLYRYPVEVGIWQTLGDAYMRSNRLKEALEAYNKAEELIR